MQKCANCPFFLYEDTDGLGICHITDQVTKCDEACHLKPQHGLTPRQTLRILHHHQKWRRGAKIKIAPPYVVGIAIDQAIRIVRENIKTKQQ